LRQLVDFSTRNQRFLAEQRVHILVVGGVAPAPMRMPGFTATGRVDDVERYFAAADVALNPLSSGAGTNVKMSEFLAVRLPVVTTRLGARGFCIEDGKTGFLFETDELLQVVSRVRKAFDEDPDRTRAMAEAAYASNEKVIDMDRCVLPLVEALVDRRDAPAERRVRAG
jgi:glycosyltransferase involved in cell wall biosynthesis